VADPCTVGGTSHGPPPGAAGDLAPGGWSPPVRRPGDSALSSRCPGWWAHPVRVRCG